MHIGRLLDYLWFSLFCAYIILINVLYVTLCNICDYLGHIPERRLLESEHSYVFIMSFASHWFPSPSRQMVFIFSPAILKNSIFLNSPLPYIIIF